MVMAVGVGPGFTQELRFGFAVEHDDMRAGDGRFAVDIEKSSSVFDGIAARRHLNRDVLRIRVDVANPPDGLSGFRPEIGVAGIHVIEKESSPGVGGHLGYAGAILLPGDIGGEFPGELRFEGVVAESNGCVRDGIAGRIDDRPLVKNGEANISIALSAYISHSLD